MTPVTIITNGVERVVVNQMHRSPRYFLIMIKVKLMRVENYYLIVELFQVEARGWILNLILKIFCFSELIEKETSYHNYTICFGYKKEKIIETFYTTNKYTLILKLKAG